MRRLMRINLRGGPLYYINPRFRSGRWRNTLGLEIFHATFHNYI